MDVARERVKEMEDREHLRVIERRIKDVLDIKYGRGGPGQQGRDAGVELGKLTATRKAIQKRRQKRKLWWGDPIRGQFAKRLPKRQVP